MAAPVTTAIPTAFSSIDGLGAPVAFFEPSQRSRVIPIACAAICGLGAALALAYGLAATATAYSRYGWAVVDVLGQTPALVFWLFIGGGLIFLLYALVTWREAVALFQGGIAFRTLTKLRAWPWDHVTALYVAVTREQGFTSRIRHRYTVEHLSGERASFNDRLEAVTELGALLGHQMVDQYYPGTAARFNDGQTANFGQLSIDQKEIQCRGRSVEWEGVESISVRRGYLEVQNKDGTRSGLTVSTIPNLDVLLLLLDHLTDLRLEE
jgi:uncharacterized protein DUF6585